MQFKREASIYTSDNQDAGRVYRVVLNPKTKEVTHIVARKGVVFTEDKVIPITSVASTTEDRVMLNVTAHDLERLPPYEETHYIPLSEQEINAAAYSLELASPLYWYPPVGGWTGFVPATPTYRAETEKNIPDNTVAVKEGAKVISADDKHVGDVERVFTDSGSDRATYFVISQGVILKEKKAVPISWVREVVEDEVHLNVSSTMMDYLREFQGA